jgi:hypothetical protein
MFELGKTYRAHSGVNVRIVSTTSGITGFPFIGVVEGHPDEFLCSISTSGETWKIHGAFDLGNHQLYTCNFSEITPWDDFVINEPVMVRDSEEAEWQSAHFAKVVEGVPCVWPDGKTSWTTTSASFLQKRMHACEYCRRPTQEELQVFTKVA